MERRLQIETIYKQPIKITTRVVSPTQTLQPRYARGPLVNVPLAQPIRVRDEAEISVKEKVKVPPLNLGQQYEEAQELQEVLQEEKVIQGIPWSVLKVKKEQPDFDFKAFIDTLSKGDLETLMDCMQ